MKKKGGDRVMETVFQCARDAGGGGWQWGGKISIVVADNIYITVREWGVRGNCAFGILRRKKKRFLPKIVNKT